jgi:hypothetical protein
MVQLLLLGAFIMGASSLVTVTSGRVIGLNLDSKFPLTIELENKQRFRLGGLSDIQLKTAMLQQCVGRRVVFSYVDFDAYLGPVAPEFVSIAA